MCFAFAFVLSHLIAMLEGPVAKVQTIAIRTFTIERLRRGECVSFGQISMVAADNLYKRPSITAVPTEDRAS